MLILGAIEIAIGKYWTVSTYIGVLLTSIGCFTPLLLTGAMGTTALTPHAGRVRPFLCAMRQRKQIHDAYCVYQRLFRVFEPAQAARAPG